MKKIILTIILFILIFTTGFSQEKPVVNSKKSYTLSANLPLCKQPHIYNCISPTISLGYQYQISEFSKALFIFSYGRDFYADYPWGSIIRTETGLSFGKKYFFEIGTGLSYYRSGIHFTAEVGGKLNIGKYIFIKGAYTPTIRTAFPFRNIVGVTIHSFTFSLGYRFDNRVNRELEDFGTHIKKIPFSIQFSTQPLFKDVLRHSDEIRYNLKELSLEFQLLHIYHWHLSTSVAYGATKYTYFFPVGLHIYYGAKVNYIEVGISYYKSDDGWTSIIQSELAYRVHLGKKFILKVGYAPYWWRSSPAATRIFNEPNKPHFVHSIKIGIGYRFNKKIRT